jgi:hypothetical protein
MMTADMNRYAALRDLELGREYGYRGFDPVTLADSESTSPQTTTERNTRSRRRRHAVNRNTQTSSVGVSLREGNAAPAPDQVEDFLKYRIGYI